MWVRKQLDIAWTDLLYGIGACLVPGQSKARHAADAESGGGTLYCHAARSAFDLLLRTLELPSGSEVLISAMTIPDMVTIIRSHGLIPVPVDLEAVDLSPRIDALHRAATASARVLVIAHLFGGRFDSTPFINFAREHDLILVEDRAQSFDSLSDCLANEADMALYSFGPIKTCTALGGGLAVVRDGVLLRALEKIQDGYPAASRRCYLRRILKYCLLKAISGRIPYALLYEFCRACRIDHDHLISCSARSFGERDLLTAIRRRPAAPMLRLLRRRLCRFNARRLVERAQKGRHLLQALGSRASVPGSALVRHTHWLFPVVVSQPEMLIATLRAAGFDATQGESLCVVPAPDDRPEIFPVTAARLLEKIVFVPAYGRMPDRELRRMAAVIAREGRRFEWSELSADEVLRAESWTPCYSWRRHRQCRNECWKLARLDCEALRV